jgi:hypothetical protein
VPEITITLVDRTTSDTTLHLKVLIARELENIFGDLLFSDSEATLVNVRWLDSSPPPNDQDLVLHFVENVPGSYISQKMPGKAHRQDGGGFTRTIPSGLTGSEFYKLPLSNGKPTRLTAVGYAKLAAHEALHNMTGMSNTALHGLGGVAGFPPKLPVNDANRQAALSALGRIPQQLV